jgi:glutamate/aspartate transport system substrate-binding protein
MPKPAARLLLAFCLACGPLAALAADPLTGTLKAIHDRGAVIIGYAKDANLMSFVGPDGQPAGYSVDLCRAIAEDAAKAAGLAQAKIQYVPVTLDNRFDMVASGKVDIECATSTITLSRMEKVDFTNMTFLSGGSLLVERGSGIHSVAGLVDETVAVIPGTTTETALRAALDKSFVNAKVVPVKDHPEGIAALESGKVSAYASDRVILLGLLIQTGKVEKFGLVDELFSYEPYGFMVRRNDADFRLVANRTLARLYRSAEVLKIFDRWFGKLGDPPPALAAMYLMNATPE